MQDNLRDDLRVNLPKNQDISDAQILDLGVEALSPSALRRFRELACRKDPARLSQRSDQDLLDTLGLVATLRSGEPCKLTLGALLLLGRPEILTRILPGREVEMTAQLLDPEGYDYHESFPGNLLETYERLMAFVVGNFPEGEAIVGKPGIFVRDVIFGEIFTNMLVHRDYSVETPSRLIFQKERLTFENPSRPRKGGLIDLAWSESKPHNPLIYRFFREIGLISEPASGHRNLLRYGEAYFGTQILAFDREIFKIIATSSVDFPVRREQSIPAMQVIAAESESMQAVRWGRAEPFGIPAQVDASSMQVDKPAMQVNPGPEVGSDRVLRILSFCESPRNREEIQKHVGLNNRDHFRKEVLLPLLQKGLLLATLPDKPNSPKQQYRTAPAFVSRVP